MNLPLLTSISADTCVLKLLYQHHQPSILTLKIHRTQILPLILSSASTYTHLAKLQLISESASAYINIANIKYKIFAYNMYQRSMLINISKLKTYNDMIKVTVYIISFILKLKITLWTTYTKPYHYWSYRTFVNNLNHRQIRYI